MKLNAIIEQLLTKLLTKLLLLLLWVGILAACSQESSFITMTPDVTPTATLPALAPVARTQADEQSVLVTPSPVITVLPTPTLTITAVSDPMFAVAAELAQATPPERDDVALAMAYRGVSERPSLTAPPITDPLPVGTRQTFRITNIDNNTVSSIEAELLAVGKHAYFWFDTGAGSFLPDPEDVAQAAAAFDEIYEKAIGYFGSENNPGIDGDPRLYIVHASPLVLCDVTLSTLENCGLAGYFSASNSLPIQIDANSNEHEMFVMNVRQFGTSFYLNVLAHEFRHMIEDNHDKGDADWEVEGSAVLAEELLGFSQVAHQRANLFLRQPDIQLNSWSDTDTAPHYGKGYLFNRYLWHRLGAELYYEFATSPATGLLALDEIAQQHGLSWTGESLWLDWLLTLALQNETAVFPEYHIPDITLNTVAMTNITSLPAVYDTTVSQYAADYYQLPDQTVTLRWLGDERVSLLAVPPEDGGWFWYAQRANYSNPRLTRLVDLRGVTQATLQYDVYVDIERGYDFAYVSVSTDNGRTWHGLEANGMQGLDEADNPAHTALTRRFYTGRHQRWWTEQIDLTPYVGQEILLRFEYVTDLVLTYDGFAVDNIAIPEIGFYDDAETAVAGWQAEGFSRVPPYLPQTWHLRLITFPQGIPAIIPLEATAGLPIQHTVEIAPGERPPILLIAATAPMTLQPAHYQLELSP
ncbi:MAG: hypothetical protein D6706_05055 [Chloroflexi bacterium]|nr:MAG: hypothetical protein D6706_05055 [Chloroflexota bacterium]